MPSIFKRFQNAANGFLGRQERSIAPSDLSWTHGWGNQEHLHEDVMAAAAPLLGGETAPAATAYAKTEETSRGRTEARICYVTAKLDQIRHQSLWKGLAAACEPPEKSGRPISHWTTAELADEVVKRGIVPAISARHVGRFLKDRRPSTPSQPLLA